MYHFISGYTAKMAGTETGVTEPVAAFSPCYGGPFLTLHPLKYAELLEKKLNEHNSSVYLVNTGWSGSSATSGSSRIDLKLTKHIINLITEGSLDFSQSVYDKFFNLEIPMNVEGLENDFLIPHLSWSNLEEYFSTGNMLTRLFNNNFEKFKINQRHPNKEFYFSNFPIDSDWFIKFHKENMPTMSFMSDRNDSKECKIYLSNLI